MIEIKAPFNSDIGSFTKIFLGGSIEGGKAEKWQDKLTNDLSEEKVVLFNPRRDDWDSSWIQDPTEGTQFHTQVTWELNHIAKSDIVVFYFDPKTQSPITLMELGLCVGKGKRIIVCCPEGYFRKGNVVITAKLLNSAIMCETYDELLEAIKSSLVTDMGPE